MTIEGRQLAPTLEVAQAIRCGRVVVLAMASFVNFNGMSSAFRSGFWVMPIDRLAFANWALAQGALPLETVRGMV